ncbi:MULTISPECIES: NAD(P)H-hydrate dehydratase [Methylotenera]|uniref:NAD(P)H-hydrate dehydratase n=1 Tax=Methylotenera TaxID=359407 RepID=UPI0003A4AAA1|nr:MULTISPECIES: NAD(P)H-hydrate dehydratase [Methylotenera]
MQIPQKNLLIQSLFSPALPPRALDSHKGNFGSVAIVGGDSGMVGAVLLAARAALFCGAGRVHAVFLADDAPIVDIQHPEIMLHSAAKLNTLKQLSCIVIGPGLGQSKAAIESLEFCMAQNVPLLIDADGLNLISQHPYLAEILQQRQAQTVITPHPAEAARLLQTTTENIQNNRVESAQNLAYKLKVVCVLKGAGTICADTDDAWFMNTTGNPSLATGGTGDVLSGIIGSLVAQGLNVLEAAKLGVYVHGAAADALVEIGIGPVGLTASEIVQEARNQINYLNKLTDKT